MTDKTDAIKDQVAALASEIKALHEDVSKAEPERRAAIEALQKSREADKAELEAKLSKITEEMAEKLGAISAIQDQIDNLQKAMERPEVSTGEGLSDDDRKAAIDLARSVHERKSADVAEALSFDEQSVDYEAFASYKSAVKKMLHASTADEFKAMLTDAEVKAMSTFSASGGTFFVLPQMSNTILSCMREETDVMSLMSQINISKGSIKFPEDNSWDEAAWACEKECFANNPSGKLLDNLGEREIVAHSLRYTACATREFLEDSSINVTSWLASKVHDAFQRSISKALMIGDGKGQPMGILNPNAGISSVTAKAEANGGAPAGGFTWQDLYALKYAIPVQYHGQGFAFMTGSDGMQYILTMSGADGHPIWRPTPQPGGGVLADGSLIRINSYMPDAAGANGWATGTAPVVAGNWKRGYTVVSRKNVTMQRDDYSAGFCVLFKFDARIGGDVTCQDAIRMLKVL